MRPVAGALCASGVVPTLIFTGQHQLKPDEFGFGGFPSLRLGCPGQHDPNLHVKAVTRSLLPLLRDLPGLLVVQGDTSSALGGALAGFAAGVPVAHVEAGLRTHDPLLPWPEEEYRTAIDADAALLFAPTELAAANLRAEKVPGEIYVTGNTSIDAVLEAERLLPRPRLRADGFARIVVTCHRRESWGEGLRSIAGAVVELASPGKTHVDVVLSPNSFVATEMTRLLSDAVAVNLIAPCSHHELLGRIRNCDLVLSDSGGIQEEAPALGIPLLVLRDKTERPEGIAVGAAILVGTDPTRIIAEARRMLEQRAARSPTSGRTFPFGDGRAGARIASIIVDWLQERARARRPA